MKNLRGWGQVLCLAVLAIPSLSVAGGQVQVPGARELRIAGRLAELSLTAVSEHTVRIRLEPLDADGRPQPPRESAALTSQDWPEPKVRLRSLPGPQEFDVGKLRVTVSGDPLTIEVATGGRRIQRLVVDGERGSMTFLLGEAPVFGLGAGGPQFDRRGTTYDMINAHGAYRLPTHGGRLPVPWLIGTNGWAMFFHEPLGTIDLTRNEAKFEPFESESPLPLDVFVVGASEPAEIMREYARLTGFPHLPPLWTLGYQQSHRTLVSRDVVLSVARTFRENKLPCDVLIYLGTGYCPSGWNTGHGSFEFNSRAFPDPAGMIRELRNLNFNVVLHVVNPPERFYGSVGDTGVDPADENAAVNYWAKHLEVLRLGIAGWWPDVAERLSVESRLARNRMYWEGSQTERPGIRPYALHRTGYAGLQRYGWLWSGDVDSRWVTLATQVPVAINTGLSGIPYWGTDIGGFYTTKELTGELYIRWFQFGAFNPLFRSHGRAWRLRLPWGWNTGELGPPESEGYGWNFGVPDTKELLNPEIELIARKYLDLRYRLMPYLYSAVREAHESGMPVMRALWLHYPRDVRAVERGDQYLWGRDILVAPVTEQGTAARMLYLPQESWYDFWTEERVEGGRTVLRPVDLATMPLYVRAGAVLPFGPVRQYTSEPSEEPITFVVYPGADGRFSLYEDDGTTFEYEKGKFLRLNVAWNDARRTLAFELDSRSKPWPPMPRRFKVRLAGTQESREILFTGARTEVSFDRAPQGR